MHLNTALGRPEARFLGDWGELNYRTSEKDGEGADNTLFGSDSEFRRHNSGNSEDNEWCLEVANMASPVSAE